MNIIYESNNTLYHYGVLGMKWGIRRYSNKDGSLTPRAKKKIAKAEKYLGRKIQTDDGFNKDGSNITKKNLETLNSGMNRKLDIILLKRKAILFMDMLEVTI